MTGFLHENFVEIAVGGGMLSRIKMGWSTCLGGLSMFEIDDDVVQELVGDTWHFIFINPQKKGLNH